MYLVIFLWETSIPVKEEHWSVYIRVFCIRHPLGMNPVGHCCHPFLAGNHRTHHTTPAPCRRKVRRQSSPIFPEQNTNKILKIKVSGVNNIQGVRDLTLSSAIVIPLSNPRCTSKVEMELVILTFTKGLVTTVTPPSIVLMVWITLMVRY